jgi:hypothetical protein
MLEARTNAKDEGVTDGYGRAIEVLRVLLQRDLVLWTSIHSFYMYIPHQPQKISLTWLLTLKRAL